MSIPKLRFFSISHNVRAYPTCRFGMSPSKEAFATASAVTEVNFQSKTKAQHLLGELSLSRCKEVSCFHYGSLPQWVCFVVRRFISFIISYRHNLAISFINNFILALFAIILLGFSLLSTPNLSVKAIPFPVIINFLPSILEPLIYQAVYH